MEQPYEKCLENGPESLSDAELLAVILRCGARGKTSLELAREILSLPGKEEGLLGLYKTGTSADPRSRGSKSDPAPVHR